MPLRVWVAVCDMQVSGMVAEDDCDFSDLCRMVKDVNLTGDRLKNIGTFQLNVRSPDGLGIMLKDTLISSIEMSFAYPINVEVTSAVKATPLLESKIT